MVAVRHVRSTQHQEFHPHQREQARVQSSDLGDAGSEQSIHLLGDNDRRSTTGDVDQ